MVRLDAAGQPVPLEPPSVTAEGADVRAGPPRPPLSPWLVVPRRGARSVTVRARSGELQAEQSYVLGPPATAVALSLEPAEPVKGRDKEAALTVRLLRPDGTPDDSGAPPVLRASTGRVEDVTRTGPGTYRARYVLPETRYPEVAILVALSAWPSPQSIQGAYGRVLVPLAAAVELPGTTEPNAELSIDIAGQSFGPVKAGPDGRFRLPVIVPPGHRFGQGRVTDAAGNERHKPIDLMLPPTDGLACVLNPQRLPADGVARARMLCATSDPLGRPVLDARVTAQARYGTLEGPRQAEGGLLEWIYTAPRGLRPEPERIEAKWPQAGPTSREELTLQLVQGPVAQASLELGDAVVHAGGAVPVTAEAKDALGRPRSGAVVKLEASLGELSAPREVTAGHFTSIWSLPPTSQGNEARVTARVFGPQGTEPARLSVWVEGGVVYAGVSDLAGLPVPAQPLRVGGEDFVTGADGTVRLGPARPGSVEVVHAVWTGLRRTLHVFGPYAPVYPVDEPLVPPPVTREARLAPAVPVNVRLQVEGARVTYWVEDSQGHVLKDRHVHVWQSAGTRSEEETREDGRRVFVVKAPVPVSVSVADVETGVTALAEVRP